MVDVYLGTVSEVFDNATPEFKKFYIKATIPNIVENIIAYPENQLDEPNVGDPIVLFGIESVLGYSFIYRKLRLYEHTRLKMGDSLIDIDDDGEGESNGTILIKCFNEKEGPSIELKKDKTITVKTDKATLIMDENGKVTLEAEDNIEITGKKDLIVKTDGDTKVDCKNAEVKAQTDCKIECTNASIKANAKCNIESQQCEVKGTKVTITGGVCEMKGMAPPKGSGPFCSLPACLFTGAPHNGDMVTGT